MPLAFSVRRVPSVATLQAAKRPSWHALMLTWPQTEFLFKGIYLGLLVMIAWLVPTWDELARIALCTLAGLALFLGVAAARKIREGYRIKGRWLGFLIFLLLGKLRQRLYRHACRPELRHHDYVQPHALRADSPGGGLARPGRRDPRRHLLRLAACSSAHVPLLDEPGLARHPPRRRGCILLFQARPVRRQRAPADDRLAAAAGDTRVLPI